VHEYRHLKRPPPLIARKTHLWAAAWWYRSGSRADQPIGWRGSTQEVRDAQGGRVRTVRSLAGRSWRGGVVERRGASRCKVASRSGCKNGSLSGSCDTCRSV
jgi:hypothetical protein